MGVNQIDRLKPIPKPCVAGSKSWLPEASFDVRRHFEQAAKDVSRANPAGAVRLKQDSEHSARRSIGFTRDFSREVGQRASG